MYVLKGEGIGKEEEVDQTKQKGEKAITLILSHLKLLMNLWTAMSSLDIEFKPSNKNLLSLVKNYQRIVHNNLTGH